MFTAIIFWVILYEQKIYLYFEIDYLLNIARSVCFYNDIILQNGAEIHLQLYR